MVKDIRKTTSDSSATQKTMTVPNYGSSADRITEPGFTSASEPYGSDPIGIDTTLDYSPYKDGKRYSEDFAEKDDDEKGNAPLDGQEERIPGKDDNRSDINTSFSQ